MKNRRKELFTFSIVIFLVISISQLSLVLLYFDLEYYHIFVYILPASLIFTAIISSLYLYLVKKDEKALQEIINNLENLNEKNNNSNVIRDRKHKLQDLTNDLKHKVQRQKQFTEDVTHELRTPLTILRGELEMALLASKSDEDYIMVIASALDEVIRLSKILETLLELTRAESGKIQLDLHKKNISNLLRDIIEDTKILAEEKDIKVKVDIDEKIVAVYDSVRMHQALLNLIDNAIKYTNKGGEIDIISWEENDRVFIEVRDTGIGIPEDKLERVFDRFFRINDKNDRETKGIGLGLSIVNMIVKAHNGKIDIESKYGEGTKFIINFPKNLNIELN